MSYGPETKVALIRRDPAAKALVSKYFGPALDFDFLGPLTTVPLRRFLTMPFFANDHIAATSPFWSELASLPVTQIDTHVPYIKPARSPLLSNPSKAAVEISGSLDLHSQVTVSLQGARANNPFVDVEVFGVFRNGQTEIRVGGFYLGEDRYAIRFLPSKSGIWQFTVESNHQAIDGLAGSFEISSAGSSHGPVRVADGFHFEHQDGKRFLPFGTTVYALAHQDAALIDETIEALADSPFNKVRMCVFPKFYDYNREDPKLFAYKKLDNGEFDFGTFNLDFFNHLDVIVERLNQADIQVDLILFHPYDRWGFSEMSADANQLYLEYVVRRYAAYPNIWWSLANEFDFSAGKTDDDWVEFGHIVTREDSFGHLLSIHNGLRFFDQTHPWLTHVSAQRVDTYRTSENTTEWRQQWNKPIVIDEVGYEGDLDHGWGNLTGPELVRRCWEGALRGGYVAHGETYLNDQQVISWSKGGRFIGSSPARIGFLKSIIEETPEGYWEPQQGSWDFPWGGSSTYQIGYFGKAQPRFRPVHLPEGNWLIDVIDTWEMTVTPVAGTHSGMVRVELPAKEYQAIRIRKV